MADQEDRKVKADRMRRLATHQRDLCLAAQAARDEAAAQMRCHQERAAELEREADKCERGED